MSHFYLVRQQASEPSSSDALLPASVRRELCVRIGIGRAQLAEYVLLEDYQRYPGSNNVSFEELCLAEPLACVIRSVNKAAGGRSDQVVVVGAGTMGILHVLLLKQAGATVYVSEPDAERAAFAREMGADAIIDLTNDSLAQ